MTRILIVDDETPLAEALSDLFETEDFDVAIAADRTGAEQLLLAEHFSVILADLRLREEDEGLRLLESIRRLSPRSKVATITGYATPEVEAQVRSLGAQQIVYKPIEFEELLRIVRDLLGEDDPAAAPEDPDVLYRDLRKVLHSLPIRRFGLSAEDAEDVVQQAWCLFFEKRSMIRQPRAWLSGTVANLCRQRIEDRRRFVADDVAAFERIVESHASDAVLALRAAFTAVDERTRALCSLIGLEDRSYEEVSARLGIPVGSVGPLYIRAKAKLRKLIAR